MDTAAILKNLSAVYVSRYVYIALLIYFLRSCWSSDASSWGFELLFFVKCFLLLSVLFYCTWCIEKCAVKWYMWLYIVNHFHGSYCNSCCPPAAQVLPQFAAQNQRFSAHVVGRCGQLTVSLCALTGLLSFTKITYLVNRLTPNDPYMGRTAPLTFKRCFLYIYSTNIGTEYFKHALYSPFFLFKMQFVSKC